MIFLTFLPIILLLDAMFYIGKKLFSTSHDLDILSPIELFSFVSFSLSYILIECYFINVNQNTR